MSLESLDHIVSGVLFDFAAFLTTRNKEIVLSAQHNAAPAADTVAEFLELRGVDKDAEPFLQWPARCGNSDSKPTYKTVDRLLLENPNLQKAVNILISGLFRANLGQAITDFDAFRRDEHNK